MSGERGKRGLWPAKRSSIKDVCSQEGKVVCQVQTRRGAFFRCRRQHFLEQKFLDFLKFMCSHRQG